MLTGLALSIVNSSFHGSILMRPPSGSAARTLLLAPVAAVFGEFGGGSAAAVPEVRAPLAGDGTAQLFGMRSPRCGLIRLGTSFVRSCSAWIKSLAVAS